MLLLLTNARRVSIFVVFLKILLAGAFMFQQIESAVAEGEYNATDARIVNVRNSVVQQLWDLTYDANGYDEAYYTSQYVN